jgi:hypothetical protein
MVLSENKKNGSNDATGVQPCAAKSEAGSLPGISH